MSADASISDTSRSAPRRRAVEGVLDRLEQRVEEGESSSVSLGHVVEAIGDRGFGPVFLALSLLVISPFGGIPTIPTIFAAILGLFAAQMLWGKRSLWVPRMFARREMRGDHLCKGVRWMRPVAKRMDRWFGRRFVALTSDAARRVAALVIIALCVMVPPLELIPFAAAIPMAGIALFGLAITVRDGLVMVAAFTASGAALIGGPWLLLSQ
ncbi:exopolysaccharide biosynthesis protein ExoD [Roseivivax halodurans JCM 10272]|uniref:Exopolysaccharide biosynthesis protein ExoD n=1 Tax=Roseivivax halodurans JCM 10272 TaxID=1449350 RepID=X7EJS7_9RHOB|nr:exopolysaccharide biosynthesis protein [Roseivivax halodurans]ETX15396.1 exopolysaccharide biosynthesis protein ExoD [Roseivivax halodurans JCM 10272]